MRKTELLAPAGDLEKLKIALDYGADAVYFGLPEFSLRARINKFDWKNIEKGAEICRQKSKKFYLTLNIYAHQIQIKSLVDWLPKIAKIQPDGLIVSDPGIIKMVRKRLPKIPLHISTQANVTNVEAVKFWQQQGASRIILAREVTLEEIKEIHQAVPEMELEYFVHGAMCMSYSGRCILSKWMTGRSANLGDCVQPCRWKFRSETLEVRGWKDENELLVDDSGRFGVEIEEDEQGTYFFNSFDLCLIDQIKELIDAGVVSFKIEGRAKSVYYVAMVTRAYRKVLDAICGLQKDELSNEVLASLVNEQKVELEKLSNRGYWTGFLLGTEPPHLFDKDAFREKGWMFCGISDESENSKTRKVLVHNFLQVGEEVEVMTPAENQVVKVLEIKNAKDEVIENAHGGQGQKFEITFDQKIQGIFLMRKNKETK